MNAKGMIWMKFLFIYYGGEVPQEETENNIDELWGWINNLKSEGIEIVGFAGNGFKSISQDGISDYEGKVFGISIIESDSADTALGLTKDWPELKYGGRIEVLQQMDG